MNAAAPAPLKAAASLVLVEAVLLVAMGIVELANLDSSRSVMGVTTAGFFFTYAAALLVCARAVVGLHSWARSPLVLAQLIQLGVAWSFHGGSTWPAALGLALLALLTLVGLLHPESIEALARED